jgi:hypothetical protein
VQKLKPVHFGAYSSTGRVVRTIEATQASGLALSEKQRLALYAICWRYRAQIADNAFTAKVLIVERLLIEMTDVADLMADRPRVRAWHKTAPAQQLDILQP